MAWWCAATPAGDGQPVADSPYPLRVAPAPPALRACEAEGPGRRAAVCGAEAGFWVQARDAYDNICSTLSAGELGKLLPLKVCGSCSAHGRGGVGASEGPRGALASECVQHACMRLRTIPPPFITSPRAAHCRYS